MTARQMPIAIATDYKGHQRLTHHVIGFDADGNIRVSSAQHRLPPVDHLSNYYTAETAEGIRALSGDQLLRLYNYLAPKGKQIKGFHTKEKGVARVWELLCTNYDPEAETLMTDTEKKSNDGTSDVSDAIAGTDKTPGSDVPGELVEKELEVDSGSVNDDIQTEGTELTDATDEQEADLAKAGTVSRGKGTKEPKEPKAKKADGVKKDGVISSIASILQDGGGTIEQIVAKLRKKFPERTEDGMKTTVKIQLTRLVKDGKLRKVNKEEVEGKPTKYWA